jgi:hypothetical protein
MTKKHFKALAELLKEHKQQLEYLRDHDTKPEPYDVTYKQLVDGIAELCGEANPNFKYSLFKGACGL